MPAGRRRKTMRWKQTSCYRICRMNRSMRKSAQKQERLSACQVSPMRGSNPSPKQQSPQLRRRFNAVRVFRKIPRKDDERGQRNRRENYSSDHAARIHDLAGNLAFTGIDRRAGRRTRRADLSRRTSKALLAWINTPNTRWRWRPWCRANGGWTNGSNSTQARGTDLFPKLAVRKSRTVFSVRKAIIRHGARQSNGARHGAQDNNRFGPVGRIFGIADQCSNGIEIALHLLCIEILGVAVGPSDVAYQRPYGTTCARGVAMVFTQISFHNGPKRRSGAFHFSKALGIRRGAFAKRNAKRLQHKIVAGIKMLVKASMGQASFVHQVGDAQAIKAAFTESLGCDPDDPVVPLPLVCLRMSHFLFPCCAFGAVYHFSIC